MADPGLVRRVKHGDRRAFDALFREYGPRLYAFALHYFNDRADAEEILQETFLTIWETRRQLDETRGFSAYLFSIAKHKIYNVLKHRAVERRYENAAARFTDAGHDAGDEPSGENLRKLVRSALDRLPPQQREIMELKARGHSNEEIARSLDISRRTVETHVYRAFKALRTYLSGHGDLLGGVVMFMQFF